MELFVIVIFLSVTGAQESQLEGPENTLSFVGSTVSLRCSSPSRNCNGIDWMKYVPGSSPMILFKGGIIGLLSMVDRDRYSVYNYYGCNLSIRNVQLTDAGLFICSANMSNQSTKSTNLTILGALEMLLEGPENTLGFVGSTVALNCSTPFRNCNGIDWQKYVSGASPMTIFKNSRILNVVDRDRYSVDNSSGCDLIIENVNLTDAGRYICSAIVSSSQTTKTAYLIILDTQPKCTLNASVNDTIEGDGVQLNCAVSYSGTNNASIDWKGVTDAPAAVKNGNTISRYYYVVENTISRSHSVVASEPDVPSFTCVTSFAFETVFMDGYTIYGLAKNSIPNAIHVCSTSAIKVLYSVRNVTLSPLYSNYPPGTVITCTARGHPSPTYTWQEMENGGPWIDIQNYHGSEFTRMDVSSKQYRCVAMNVVRDKIHNYTSHEFLVNNSESDSTATQTEDAVIPLQYIMMSIAAGFLFLIILFIVCFCVPTCPGYKWHHSRSKSKDKIRKENQLGQNPDISSNINQVGEQESAYASLGADRDENEYMSIEQRQKAKPRKQKKEELPLGENPDVSRNINQVGEQESAYASLGADRDVAEYMSLEQKQKPKPEKRSKL